MKEAKTRFLKAAMSEGLATWNFHEPSLRGIPTEELHSVYTRWAEGGYGIILSGNIMIELDQLEAAGNMIIPPDAPFTGERFEAFQKLALAAKAGGSLFFGQLSHPGRQVSASIQPVPISASNVPLEENEMSLVAATPRPMVDADFDRVVKGFAHAARYCYEAGFDGIQLHAAQ